MTSPSAPPTPPSTHAPTAAPDPAYRPVDPSQVRITGGPYRQRRDVNLAYLASLTDINLLQNHHLEAGVGSYGPLRTTTAAPGGADDDGDDRHWGWETPGCQLRGHFLGHWMSAVAREVASTGDAGLRHRLEGVVAELARCQQENGGEWVFSIPTRYLDRIATGRHVWAPQYTAHKTLMGLVDTYRDTGDERALEVAHRASGWFLRWSEGVDPETWDDILDVETGGMLEVWADMLAATGDERYRTLLERYDRRRLFDRLLADEDALTNMHANTTIPEVLGAARAYEVTGETRWRDVVLAYWRWAVDRRGTFCTGGQTSGEIWTPPKEFAARRGDKNQEHCTVYNMMRLAEVLFRWTGEAHYLDYYERNAVNGVLAQQHPRTGMPAYFLPLAGGSSKRWGHPTYDFWCCHGTLVQAHTRHHEAVFFVGDGEIVVGRHVDASVEVELDGRPVQVDMRMRDAAVVGGPDANAHAAGSRHRPTSWNVELAVGADGPEPVRLRVRIPSWVASPATATLDGVGIDVVVRDGFATLDVGPGGVVALTLPTAVRAEPIPDEPGTVAFLDGPTVLAAECDHEPTLEGDPAAPEALLVPDDERQWGDWRQRYRTVGQSRAWRFRPLHEITDEPYTVYFPVRQRR